MFGGLNELACEQVKLQDVTEKLEAFNIDAEFEEIVDPLQEKTVCPPSNDCIFM